MVRGWERGFSLKHRSEKEMHHVSKGIEKIQKGGSES